MTNLNFLSKGGHYWQFGTDSPRHFFSIFTHIHIYTLHIHIHISGFSRWLSGKESAYQCRKHRLRDSLKKEIETHHSIIAWEIPWTEEPGRLQSMGLQRSQT